MHFFVAQLRFAENLWLQLKLHELFHSPALDKHLWPLFINRHAELILLPEKKRVFLRRKFEPEFVEQRAKLFRLPQRKQMRVRIHSATD